MRRTATGSGRPPPRTCWHPAKRRSFPRRGTSPRAGRSNSKRRDAARFAFLLATPVILAAGVLKLPTLAGPAAAHIHGPVILGAVVAGVAAYLSVRWLTRYFETRTLTPFAIYCVVAGVICIVRFT